MSWQDRVQGKIDLVSPDGEAFSAKWIGNTRSVEKKLGTFTYPKLDGTIVQDLGLAGTRYPLTLHFDGEDNDLEASRFFDAFSARGAWKVTHPTKGLLTLQPMSVTENIEPVESGSITVFDTEWIAPILPDAPVSVVSVEQLSTAISDQASKVDDTALTQMTDTVKQETVEEVNAIKNAVEKALSAYDKTVASILETSGEIKAQVEAVRRGVVDTLSTTPLDLTVLGGQIQAVMALPAKIEGEVLKNLKPFNDFVDQVATLPDEIADQVYKNTLAIDELFLTSANTSMALISASGVLDTRAQALEATDLITSTFKNITDSLDEAQKQYG